MISDRIIEKAAQIWADALRSPNHDNGDTSEQGFFGNSLANMNADSDAANVDDMADRIENFRNLLITDLKVDRDKKGDQFYPWLNVDYNPCIALATPAKAAGIPESQFSIKSSVNIESDYVSVSFGYSTPRTYYYPLSDNRWLKTQLAGPEMQAVIECIEASKEYKFIVE